MISKDSDIPYKLIALKQSKFRSKFELAQKDRDYITTKGLETIKEHAFQFIHSRVAPDFPKNDGKQTPMRGHPESDNLSTNETYLCAIRNKTGKKIFSNHITLHKLDRQRY